MAAPPPVQHQNEKEHHCIIMTNTQIRVAQPSVNRLLRRKNVVDLVLLPVHSNENQSTDLEANPMTPSITTEFDDGFCDSLRNGRPALSTSVSPRDPSLKTSILNENSATIKTSLTRPNFAKDCISAPVQSYGTPSQQVVVGSACDQPSIQPIHEVSPPEGSNDSQEQSDSESDGGPIKANTGRWTEAEHKLFLKGLETFPYRAWKKIATLIKTRTVVQIRTHAQKYYQKLEKEEAKMKEREQQLVHKVDGLVDTSSSNPLAPSLDSVFSSTHKRKCNVRKRKFTRDDADYLQLSKKLLRDSSLDERTRLEPHHLDDTNHACIQAVPVNDSRNHILEPDDRSSSLILDFAEEKNITEFPLQAEGAVDHALAAMDNDELLLSDDENLDWFSSTSPEHDPVRFPDTCTLEPSTSSTLDLSQCHSPLYPDCLDAQVDGSIRIDDLNGIGDDDDFVLDPEKFLSSYLK